MKTPAEKAAAFRALHERPGAFIIPNPWDAGTARLLASLGFEALATTSLGLVNSLGRVGRHRRGEPRRGDRELPGDRGGDRPARERGPRERLRPRAARRGRDHPARRGGGHRRAARSRTRPASPQNPIYDFALAVERVQAAVEVARVAARSVRADRAGREPPARAARPRRHDPAAAGLREGRRRRALRAGRCATSRRSAPSFGGGQAGQRRDERGGSRPSRRPSSPRPASSASAWAARCRAWPSPRS